MAKTFPLNVITNEQIGATTPMDSAKAIKNHIQNHL